MHISEGVLSGPVLAAGMTLAATGAAIGLRKLKHDKMAHAGLLSAAFFVASLVHVPIGPSSVHLIFNGMVGVILGWGAFPVILVGLLLQAVFFQFGGITTLGVNTVIMALPAVLCYYLFGRMLNGKSSLAAAAGFACGFVSVLTSGLLVALALTCTDENFIKTSAIILAAHLPVMAIEGVVSAFCVVFLRKVQPALLPEVTP